MIAIAPSLHLESTDPNSSWSPRADRSNDCVTLLSPGASARLANLSDGELLTRTQDLVGKSNQVLAALLEHLAEVQARGLYRQRACASLYTYCIYELRFSEDAAARRSSAAKLTRRFPAILPAVAAGEIHLTGLLMLGPHLTDENQLTLLALAKFRTKKEIAKLIRRVAPLPLVPDRLEPLGSTAPSLPNPTWAEFIESLCPPVRRFSRSSMEGELHPREPSADNGHDSGPGNAVNAVFAEKSDPLGRHGGEAAALARRETALHREDDSASPGSAVNAVFAERVDPPGQRWGVSNPPATPARGETALHREGDSEGLVSAVNAVIADPPGRHGGEAAALARRKGNGAPRPDATQLYLMQFTTTEEHAELVERARALLSHRSGKVSLGELHIQAMRLLVKALEKERFGAKVAIEPCRQAASAEAAREREWRQRGRYVPARVRRAVFERDGGCCSYVDERGVRCGEAHYLEVHHVHAFALGGEHEHRNLALRCHAHNALAAEQDFGREHVEQRERARNEPEQHAQRGTDVGLASDVSLLPSVLQR